MKRPDTKLKLVGPSGDKELWTISFAIYFLDGNRRRRFNKKDCGHTDWVNRIVTINSRLRNLATIKSTVLHEISHVTTGQNASDELAENLEYNYSRAAKATGVE